MVVATKLLTVVRPGLLKSLQGQYHLQPLSNYTVVQSSPASLLEHTSRMYTMTSRRRRRRQNSSAVSFRTCTTGLTSGTTLNRLTTSDSSTS